MAVDVVNLIKIQRVINLNTAINKKGKVSLKMYQKNNIFVLKVEWVKTIPEKLVIFQQLHNLMLRLEIALFYDRVVFYSS